MKKVLCSLVLVLALSGVGFAQEGFAGASLSGLYFSNVDNAGTNVTLGFLGGQVGSYNLLGPVGLRGAIDFSVSPISGLLSVSADVLFASDGDTRFYGGAGLGIISIFGLTTPFVEGVAGVDFDVSDSVGLFAEATPRYFTEVGDFLVGGRFGVNFRFGEE